jgi:hypothetical protein
MLRLTRLSRRQAHQSSCRGSNPPSIATRFDPCRANRSRSAGDARQAPCRSVERIPPRARCRRTRNADSRRATSVASFLSPDGAERSEAALVRRLDLLTRQVQRLERTNRVTMETLALFVRFFLTVTPPLPPDALASAQAERKQRYEEFIEAPGQRLQKGRGLLDEIPEDVDPAPRSNGGGAGQSDRRV